MSDVELVEASEGLFWHDSFQQKCATHLDIHGSRTFRTQNKSLAWPGVVLQL